MCPSVDGWTFSVHALERCLDMALDATEIRECLANPETITPSGPKYAPDTRVYARGRFALAVAPDAKCVITALWRGEVYDRGEDERFWRDDPQRRAQIR